MQLSDHQDRVVGFAHYCVHCTSDKTPVHWGRSVARSSKISMIQPSSVEIQHTANECNINNGTLRPGVAIGSCKWRGWSHDKVVQPAKGGSCLVNAGAWVAAQCNLHICVLLLSKRSAMHLKLSWIFLESGRGGKWRFFCFWGSCPLPNRIFFFTH